MNAVHMMMPGPANLKNATMENVGSSSEKLPEFLPIAEAGSSFPRLLLPTGVWEEVWDARSDMPAL